MNEETGMRTGESLGQNLPFRQFMDGLTNISVQGYGADAIVHYWNAASESVYGYTPEEAIGRDLVEMIIPPEMRDRVRAAIAEGGRTGIMPPACELLLMRKDGTSVPVFSSHVVVPGKNGVPEMYCIDLDLRTVKKNEAENLDLQAQLMQSHKMEAIGRLAGGVAHDFNNILTALSGYSELLHDHVQPHSEAESHTREIQQCIERATRLTRQLLAFSRRQLILVRDIDLNEVVRSNIKMLERLLGEDISVELDLDPRPCLTRADPTQIEQVLLNLAINARDAMSRGGRICLSTVSEPRQVKDLTALVTSPVSADPGPYITLSVSDTGTGIQPEAVTHIFEPFFTTKTVGQGTGMGLSTVHGIVHQHGGLIGMSTTINHGTTFHIYLPVTGNAPAATQSVPKSSVAANGAGTMVLLVEDDVTVSCVLHQYLKREGYRVLKATNPVDALALMGSHAAEIRLVITDVVMPDMDGKTLANEIRRLSPRLPVLFITGHVTERIEFHGLSLERDAILFKPFTPDMLAARIREMLSVSNDQMRNRSPVTSGAQPIQSA